MVRIVVWLVFVCVFFYLSRLDGLLDSGGNLLVLKQTETFLRMIPSFGSTF